MASLPKSVLWHQGVLLLLDQTQLPFNEVTFPCHEIVTVYEAIQSLKVRGAPAIGLAAAYGLIVGLKKDVSLSVLQQRAAYLISARPTAVNLAWAVNTMMSAANRLNESAGMVAVDALLQTAQAMHLQDIEACSRIGNFGMPLIQDHPNLLTHCNAGALAVSELGTALAPVYKAAEQGVALHVYVDETRPLLQGARLTTYELGRSNIPNTLICDNMAAHIISTGKVDAVIVGADRVARNGDVANKIGTLNLAILCQHFGIPFYVACPESTIDMQTASGQEIEIEERHPDEVICIQGKPITLSNVSVSNPAFDVTPADLVTCLITNKGLVKHPNEAKLLALAS